MDHRILVLATRNKGKLLELKKLLSSYPVHIKSLDDFGPIPEVLEDGKDFEENAYKKAHFTAKVLGLPAIADDSGLVVPALGGEPGVRSARYAGENADDVENNLKLVRAMAGKEDRDAYFQTVIAIAVPWGPALIYEGRCDGRITLKPEGANGFGYDPVFYYPPLKKTFAQMSLEEKNGVSHRGMAMSEMKNEFDKVLKWLELRLKEEPQFENEPALSG
ncbi:MAG: XTP/dITP diphosphatase [Deltaproteobacteria bacterium]|nr:XTP/dITP diphosphatase [Deltaproteobacteria bacterium]